MDDAIAVQHTHATSQEIACARSSSQRSECSGSLLPAGYTRGMTAQELLARLDKCGCPAIRHSRGSHVQVRLSDCRTTVPDHGHGDLGPGLLRTIERDCEPCLGKGWLRRGRPSL
jgi:predicted RNA binding protein YcfA (HicA-like mRNA interferase family)